MTDHSKEIAIAALKISDSFSEAVADTSTALVNLNNIGLLGANKAHRAKARKLMHSTLDEIWDYIVEKKSVKEIKEKALRGVRI